MPLSPGPKGTETSSANTPAAEAPGSRNPTPEAMVQATNFVEMVEVRQALKIACLEEIAWRLGFIDEAQLKRLAEPLADTSYGKYLSGLLRKHPLA